MVREKTEIWLAKVKIRMKNRLAFNLTDVKKTRRSSKVAFGCLDADDGEGNLIFDIAKCFKGFLVQRVRDTVGGVTVDRVRHGVTVIGESVTVGTIKDLIGSKKKVDDYELPKGYPTPLTEFGLKQDKSSFQTYWYELDVTGEELEIEVKSWAKGVTPDLIEKLAGFGYIGHRHGRLTIGEFELVDFQVTSRETIVG